MVAERYAAIEAERVAHGDQRRHLTREESAALIADLYGPTPQDPEATAWALHLFGETGTPAA